MSYKLRSICLPCSSLFVFLLICLSSGAQNFESVDQLLKQNQKALGNYVVLVSREGKLIYQKQASTDFTAKTTAPILGAGDWMTAALVMTFVDEGKLSLDDKVAKYIPLFATYMKGYITIRNCLTNTTGIRTPEETRAPAKIKAQTLEDEVNAYASKYTIGTNPGTEFFYSYIGPNIAARVLEVVSKKGFERLMMERILRPLKMRGTSFTNDEGGGTNPSGGSRSTANDYISFLEMLLNKGISGDKRILSENAVQELEKMQFADLHAKYMPKNMDVTHFCLGSYITNVEGSGSSTVYACPNMAGTAPFIDTCRKYAAILITEKPVEEQKKALYLTMKNLLDEQISCP
jgi:CubicO group peptidase (beta-lactamase class C family)